MRVRKWVYSLLISLLAFPKADAQLAAIEALANKVTDIGLYSHMGWPSPHAEVGASQRYWNGFGIEMSFTVYERKRLVDDSLRKLNALLKPSVARYKEAQKKHARDSLLKALADSTAPVKAAATAVVVAKKDSLPPKITRTPVEDVVTRLYRPDSIVQRKSTLSQPDGQPTETSLSVDFGLAYTQSQTFRRTLDPVAPGLDSGEVRGGIREFPAVSVYVTFVTALQNDITLLKYASGVQPYFGVFGGVVNVTNLRAFSPNPALAAGQPIGIVELKGDGSTFEGGASFGLMHNLWPNLHVFVEGAHTWRVMPSIDWSGAPSGVLLPKSLPRVLDLSGFSLSFGMQVHIAGGR